MDKRATTGAAQTQFIQSRTWATLQNQLHIGVTLSGMEHLVELANSIYNMTPGTGGVWWQMSVKARNASQATEWAAKRAEAVARAKELRAEKAKGRVDDDCTFEPK